MTDRTSSHPGWLKDLVFKNCVCVCARAHVYMSVLAKNYYVMWERHKSLDLRQLLSVFRKNECRMIIRNHWI